mgnify:CR=1 FL=1
MNTELLEALNILEKEKDISKETCWRRLRTPFSMHAKIILEKQTM